MKKLALATIIIVVLIVLFAGVYFVFFSRITEKQYNGIMCYYISHYVTKDAKTFEEKVLALRDFVHRNIHPIDEYYNRLDTVAAEKLNSGIGWCDQQCHVFIQLARCIGLTSRLLFLHSEETGDSPHSIAEVLAPDNRWVIVDPLYRLDLINKDGKLASQEDIKNDPSIITNNRRIRLRSQYALWWNSPQNVAIYYNKPRYVVTKKGIRFDVLKIVPLTWFRPIVNTVQDRYFREINPNIKDADEWKMLKARGAHLLGYYDKSEKLYDAIIQNSKNALLLDKAQYYKAVLLKDRGKYQEADRYIIEITKRSKPNPYHEYLLGIRSRALERMGRSKEANEVLKEAEYSLAI